MKPVIIIAIAISLLFIVSSNHDAFAQVQVNTEPYKNLHHIDETNYLTVKINKVIPNTDFCVRTTQNGNSATYHIPIKLDSSNNNVIVGHTQKITLPKDFKDGHYTAEVFYGNCHSNDSFGNDSVRILFNTEPSKITKFIQDNYFPEKIDVGIKFQKNDSFSYGDNCLEAQTKLREICGDITIHQNWKNSNDYVNVRIIYSEQVFKNLNTAGLTENKKFKCGGQQYRLGSNLFCIGDQIIIKTDSLIHGSDSREEGYRQSNIFMDTVIKKINSNPIPSSSALSSMHSLQDTTQSPVPELSRQSSPIPCGAGTMEKNGQCVVNPNYDAGESLVPGFNFFDSLIEMFSSWFGE